MKRIAAALSALSVATASLPFSQAHAAALYFEKSVVKTSSEKTCLSFASDVANSQRFRNAHRSASEVAGEKDGAYVAITCVGRPNQQAVAVVMSTSESFETAKAVGRAIADRIKGIACFDTPC
ncbi:MAG TPA: hypothetical protein VLW55_23530 [Burkholderiaceae bacterium]|nr:hypothetical protein [Burkholderiaceae bacterium]